ncbi:YdcF family protein [Candidatus Woesearchaeota archaeon]|nr:YdcF family protein [Candidatus Woesearchaeota archaeon]
MSSYRNVLIVLGCPPRKDGRPSDQMISRVRKAVQLFRKNSYSKVILSGGTAKYGVPEAIVMRVMVLNFITPDRIIVEKNSRDTVHNAVFCWELLKSRKPKSVTVVTSEYHIRRAKYIFTRLYAHMGVSLRFEAAQDTFDPIESVYYHIKERLLLVKIKLFGFG